MTFTMNPNPRFNSNSDIVLIGMPGVVAAS